ncbi:MAG: trypsin-like peptidase domain-containing protein [Coxiellaceae bacterium]|nr:trypsin-like peptidase domain-containing protein [Coxiellaceae bacterium]
MRLFKGLTLIIFSILLVSYAETIVFADTRAPHSYSSAVKLAAPAVVNVFTDRSTAPQQDISRGYQRNYSRGVNRSSLGSGVIIDKRGDVLTNYHVVRNASRILVAVPDGRRVPAKLIGQDQETDLAVLHINLPDLHAAILGDSDKVEVGDVVLAIGNPFGLGQTVTQGIVSAIGRNTVGINQLENYIQTDAAINPGNSGGALVNTHGKLIGINTGIYSRSGGYQGVGFAIPIDVALNVMNQIMKTGSVKRGWLGVHIRTVNETLIRQMKLSHTSGVVIVGLVAKSPALKAGLKVGDVVTSLNNQRVSTSQGFLSYIAQRKPGSTVIVVFSRNGQTHRLPIEVGTRPPQPLIDDRGSTQDKSASAPF